MNRAELQQLADSRTGDAEALLNAGQWSGAYYLAGYAIECALKACIAKMTNQYEFPNRQLAQQCHTHNIEELVRIAGLNLQRAVDMSASPILGTNWLIVKDWDEKARYQQWSELQARKLFAAVNDANHGVLSWIKVRW